MTAAQRLDSFFESAKSICSPKGNNKSIASMQLGSLFMDADFIQSVIEEVETATKLASHGLGEVSPSHKFVVMCLQQAGAQL